MTKHVDFEEVVCSAPFADKPMRGALLWWRQTLWFVQCVRLGSAYGIRYICESRGVDEAKLDSVPLKMAITGAAGTVVVNATWLPLAMSNLGWIPMMAWACGVALFGGVWPDGEAMRAARELARGERK
jgi:hypothetical protein